MRRRPIRARRVRGPLRPARPAASPPGLPRGRAGRRARARPSGDDPVVVPGSCAAAGPLADLFEEGSAEHARQGTRPPRPRTVDFLVDELGVSPCPPGIAASDLARRPVTACVTSGRETSRGDSSGPSRARPGRDGQPRDPLRLRRDVLGQDARAVGRHGRPQARRAGAGRIRRGLGGPVLPHAARRPARSAARASAPCTSRRSSPDEAARDRFEHGAPERERVRGRLAPPSRTSPCGAPSPRPPTPSRIAVAGSSTRCPPGRSCAPTVTRSRPRPSRGRPPPRPPCAGERGTKDTSRATARRLSGGRAPDRSARTIVKSKSMVTEEIGLNAALEARGLEPVETDPRSGSFSSPARRPRIIVRRSTSRRTRSPACSRRSWGPTATSTPS